jgi:hypothetical protein
MLIKYCYTAAPGSNPARHPSLQPRKIQVQKKNGADFFLAQQQEFTGAAAGISARHQG